MDEWTKYTAFKIPQRQAQDAAAMGDPISARQAGAALTAGADFAEIEFETSPDRTAAEGAALRVFPPATPPQPIAQKAPDPIRQKFFEMRSLAVGRPFARDDAALFYKQAKLMEDFTDDFEGGAKFFMYFPYYQHMGYEQLRTYFTWRAKARQGEILPVSVSYAFLYVYELLTGVGVRNPTEGLDKLVEVWNGFMKYDAALSNYLPQWLKDYHIYYYLQHSFSDFVKEHNLHGYYPEMFLFDDDIENSLELWNCISDYDVTDSTFYKAGNEQLMGECFKAVLTGIQDMCKGLSICPDDLFIYRYSRVGAWYPFRQALFYPWQSRPDRHVNMPGQERYQCKNNRWSAYIPIYYSSQKQTVGAILKMMESRLRQAVKFKYKLKAEPCVFYRSSGTPIVFDQMIEKAVEGYYKDLTRTVVTVDHTNLARIRKEALGTQDKLIVPDNIDYHEIPEPEPQTQDPGGWPALAGALSETERKALLIALNGGAEIKAFADENAVMLEVLADGINEKATDYIGDNILELDGVMAIFDEYRGDVAKMLDGI